MKKPRLSRTLKRNPTVRSFTEDDIKYLWALNQEGGMGDRLPAQEFKEKVIDAMDYDYGYTLEANTSKGFLPIGMIFSRNAGPFLHINDIFWFSWASKRNIVESAVNFVNNIREITVITYNTLYKDNDFCLHIVRHGIARRVGTINGEVNTPFYQSRN